MPADNTAALAESARHRHDAAMTRTRAVLRTFDSTGDRVTYAKIADAARVSRAWLYTQPDIRAAVDHLRGANNRSVVAPVPTRQRTTDAGLIRRLEVAHQRNLDLSRQLAGLREQLAAVHGELRAVRAGARIKHDEVAR